MKFLELAKRNLKETFLDPLSLGLTIALPIGLFFILQTLGKIEDLFKPTMLAPGIVLFGFVMIVFSSYDPRLGLSVMSHYLLVKIWLIKGARPSDC